MAIPQFSKLGKKASDLFKKEYDYKNEVKVVSNASGVKLETGGYQAKSLTGYNKANFKTDYLGAVELEVHSSGSVKGSCTFNKVADGVNVVVSGSGAGDVAVESTYEQDLISCTVKASHNLNKASTGITASAVLGLDGVNVGGSLNLDAAKLGAPKDYNLGAEYSQKDLTASLVTSNKGEDITLSYFQSLSKTMQIGSSMLVKPDAGTRLFTFGCNYKLDSATHLKAKADSTGIVGTSVTHVLASPAVKLQVSAQFDALSSDALAAQKFGVSASLGDF